MWQGKKKAVTFSFDDGVTQDIRLTELFNKYHLKGTFNLNSGHLGTYGQLDVFGKKVNHNKVNARDVKEIYAGHEVAAHTLTHPLLTELDEYTIIRQVEEDRKALESLCGYPVTGMAYPCGGVNNDDRVAKIIGENTPIRYARTITSTFSFAPQKNLLRFNPTVYIFDGNIGEVVKAFLAADGEEPKLLYIWGHSYELDADKFTWEQMEELCKEVSGKSDIFYGTNREVLL